MKFIAAIATAALIVAPSIASATYVCDKRWSEMHPTTCPSGSTWDASSHACIITGS